MIGAEFFGYTQAVASELAGRGIEVLTFDEKRSNRNSAKMIYRLSFGTIPTSSLARYHRRLANEIIAARVPDVLLIGVEVIDRPFVATLAEAGIRVHLHMWDAAANQGRFRRYLDLLTSCSTFDPRDADDFALTYIPLFAQRVFGEAREVVAKGKADVVFCGTIHSSRGAFLCRLIDSIEADRRSLLLYYHSRGLFAVKAFTEWKQFKLLGLISSRPFPKSDVARLFASSRFVLDLPHPRQTGLTARTFEALLAGARLMTTNAQAKRLLPSTLAARVQIVERAEEIAELLRREVDPLPALTADEIYYLSLARYADQILNQMGGKRPRPIGPRLSRMLAPRADTRRRAPPT